MNEELDGTRQERREARRRKKREKMPQHGASLKRVYKDAVLKRRRKKTESRGERI